MSSEYERPVRDHDAMACAYTTYDDVDEGEVAAAGAAGDASGTGEGVERDTVDSVEGEVPATGAGAEGVERDVWQALYRVEDPEMPISIVDLGLIYGVDVEDGVADVNMTLTYTGCPARDMLLGEVERAVAAVDGIEDAEITLVWSPGWTVDMVTEQGRRALREFGLSV